MSLNRFSKFAWGLLLYNFAVIVWGAFVRASFSGDGCGNHWPHCGENIIPGAASSTKMWVEFIHRGTSGLIIPLVIVLLIWAFRQYPKGHHIRKGAVAILVFTIIEALIGAVLVKLELVASDASARRAIVLCLHLVNTFLLLGSLTLTALWSSGTAAIKLRGQGAIMWAVAFSVLGMILLAITGGVAALGDTLFKAESLAAGMARDFSPTAHFLERLRPFHPLIAMSVGVLLVLVSGLLSHFRPSDTVSKYAKWVTFIFGFELLAGLVNLLLNAPIPMQLFHLLVADVLWVSIVMLFASALAEGVPQVEHLTKPIQIQEIPAEPRTAKIVVKEYIALTKPRVISLLLFTTVTALFAAAGGWPGFWLLMAVMVGGYMSAGSANAINMVIDRDIDGTMKRTSKRPTVTQNISSTHALAFAFTLGLGSFLILWLGANLLTAMLAMAGLAFYVVIYTLLLKRRTWHNIVIGGAAGAFPPLVGWAAYDNAVPALAWFLFAIIFVWTPVHFWALALLIKDDYAKANVPMLPVVHGDRVTVIQIGFYAILTTVISILPVMLRTVSWTYVGFAMLLNAVLLVRCYQLYTNIDRPHAVSLYKYSMLYLALLFLGIAIDRAWML